MARPFRIYISLLDKWEIGSLLTEALVFDCFKALRDGTESGADTDTGSDVSYLDTLLSRCAWLTY